NRGAETLNSFDLSWSDGVNTYTDSLVDLSISPLGTYEFSHSSTKNLVEAIQYGVEVWTSNPNGTDDLMLENDTTSTVLNGVSYIPAKKVVGEEGTGTWCGWCPRGTVAMDYMGETYENFIGIAVHNEDPMAVAEYDAGITAFPDFPGFPSALIDRVEIIDPGDLEIYYSTYIERVSPVAPSVDTAVFEVYSGDLVVDVSTEFVTKMEDIDFNVAVVITEDNVVGTSSDWDQSNYYSGGGNGEMGGFENLPDPVPADQMVYNHVARTILDSYEGVSGIVPDTVVAGNTIAESFHYSVPSDQDPANMHAIVMLIDNRTGEVLNADSKKVEVLCPDDLEITAEITPDTTNTEEAEGSITLDIGLDLEPYTYEWSNGSTESSLFGITDGTYTVTVTTKYGCTQTVEFTVETLTDVADIRGLNHISLTPNPATDQALLDVQFSQPVNMKVQLVNAIGQVLIEEQGVKISGDQYRFDLSNFANGVYLVRLLVDGQVHTERLVIGR
ncbi:MAG: T9SS type A sorting domain-containing protein, partial [Bacteroidetes bacterium]|nr:T9SS type A sorting domain-containing protein [Bacteroidota bacterium]